MSEQEKAFGRVAFMALMTVLFLVCLGAVLTGAFALNLLQHGDIYTGIFFAVTCVCLSSLAVYIILTK